MTALILLLISCSKTTRIDQRLSYDQVKENFQNLQQEYGVNCWWWWLNGNVTREAITKDLEAMKSRNFHGAMIFDAGGHNQQGNKDIPAGPLFGSDEWTELFVFALDEAKRLGLEMGFNIQSGWNLGGARVTPEYAAKQLTYSLTEISGGSKITYPGRKDFPDSTSNESSGSDGNEYPVSDGNSSPLLSGGKSIVQLEQPESRLDFYKDIAVLAIPVKKADIISKGISDLDLKLGFHELGMSAPDSRFLLTNEVRRKKTKVAEAYRVRQDDIVDLTLQMDAQGNLEWEIPEGDWHILRIGYTCTRSHVSTSSAGWKGSVLDYMSREAFDFYWTDVVEPIFESAGEHVGITLKYMETDSWECGGMNWTDKFADEFLHYRGYDLLKFLPVVAGFVVDDIESSNCFLADFRKTIGDLVACNHYARFQEYAHSYNMGIQPESAGPHAGPMDGIKNYGFSDIVMSEFWSPSRHRPRPENRFYLKQASSAAHIYGKKIVGAESFTTIGPQWNDELWHDQKSAFDHEICAGLNRMYFHTFTCSPKEMGLPGQEYFAGTHVNPQVTWWNQSAPFIDYMHRVQSVVQEGKFVADVLYYYGDHVPNIFPHKHSDPAGVMPGFDYDVTDETILLQLKVKGGMLVVPGGVEYRILVLPDHRVLSLAVLKHIEELVKKGAIVLGSKPERTVSMEGGEKAQKEFRKLSDLLWGSYSIEKNVTVNERGDITGERGERDYGKGKVVWGMSARDYLLRSGILQDFSLQENINNTGSRSARDSRFPESIDRVPGKAALGAADNSFVSGFDYIHYTIGNSDVYFVSNQTNERRRIKASFRIEGKQPELWDALSGEIREAKAFTQKDGLTTIPLTFEPYGSVIVVFNTPVKPGLNGESESNYPDSESVQILCGSWDLSFDPVWGGPEKVTFPELLDWTLHTDPGIKYYSGTAVYHKAFNLQFDPDPESRYFLELGSVKDVGIAEVKINGIEKGIVWTPPFRVEITDDLRGGENTLEIKVVNSWYNRVAGDEIEKTDRPYTSTNIIVGDDFRGRPLDIIPLEPSGLLGPVEICASF